MASTYENDLRLEEMATGENSGSWGTKTNTNLELIADAFSYGTETIANADTTITIADGAADAARSLALKINSSEDLTTTRVVTLAPNTTSKVWIIENNTSGGQTLTISAGSGTNITLENGKTKIIATDGIGAGSNVVELTQDIAIADLFVDDDLTVGDDIIMDSDGGILKIGADADLQVTHSGSAGTITNATGDLTLDVAGDIILDADGADIRFLDNGAQISKITNASNNLEIHSSVSNANMVFKGNDGGVTITALTLDMSEAGKAIFNAGAELSNAVTITTDDNSTQLTLESTDTDASGGPILDLFRNSSSPEANDFTGKVRFSGRNNNSQTFTAAEILTKIQDVADGSEDGDLRIYTMRDGTSRNRLAFYTDKTVFNDDSIDADFRVESNSNANMLFVDGGTDRIGIGTSNPDRFIHAKTSGNVQFRFETTSESTAQMEFKNDAQMWAQGVDNLDQFFVYDSDNAHSALTFIPLDEVVFNQNSKDVDFRVESDNNTHALFVDAQYGYVGINRTAPSYDLDVNASFRTIYSVPAYTSTTGTGASSDYWKLGRVSNLVGSRSLKIRILGTSSYSPGNIAGETTILFRANNSGTTTNGTFWSETSGNNHVAAVAWKQTGTNDQFDIWVKWASSFAGTDIFVETAGQWVFDITNTGSTSQPSGSTTISPRKANYVGDRLALNLQTTEVSVNDTSSDMDFRVESDSNANMLFVDAGNNQVNIGTTTNYGSALNVFTTGTDALEIVSDNGNGNAGPYLDITRKSSSPADGDSTGAIRFLANSDAAETTVASINTVFDDVSNASEDSSLFFKIRQAGAQPNVLDLSPSETVVNNDSYDRDFRVESGSNTHALVVDAGENSGRGGVIFGKNTFTSSTNGAYFSDLSNFYHLVITTTTDTASYSAQYINRHSSTGQAIVFRYQDNDKGNITINSGSVSYNTTSDHRLKENVVDLTGATARLKQLEPKRFNFIADADTTVDGFLAHEVQTLVPEAITGTHNEVDADGNPVYQGIDQSKLVPLLVATIKELEARITALENA
jgi:hypothetical protein